MNANLETSSAWFRLILPIAVLMVVAAGLGLFIEGIYRDNADLVAQALGQDAITLFVALPVLLVSGYLAARGSRRARLVLLGVLVYLVYTYASYAFGIHFNPLFLVYVALLGCATYALIGGLSATDWPGLKAAFAERTPVKGLSIFLIVMALIFYLIWLSEAGPAVLSGTTPQSILDDGTATNVVHVLDMAWMLPAMLIAAVNLWRHRPLGYGLAAVVLANLALLALAVLAMIVVQARAGVPPEIPLLAVFGVLFVASVALLRAHLQHLRA